MFRDLLIIIRQSLRLLYVFFVCFFSVFSVETMRNLYVCDKMTMKNDNMKFLLKDSILILFIFMRNKSGNTMAATAEATYINSNDNFE